MSNGLKLSVPDNVPFINFEGELNFPVADVFRAYQDPDLLKEWPGPRGLKMDIDHYHFVARGSYRYVHTGTDGIPYTFSGGFRHGGRYDGRI